MWKPWKPKNPTIQNMKDKIKFIIRRAISQTETNREIWNKIKMENQTNE